MTLSLCMIVKNEAEKLPRCLESVEELVDEMIVVDTGSTDRTLEIAKSYGAKVYSAVWNYDFSEARNRSLRHAQSDWILVLDADEVLVPSIIPAIRQIISQADAIVVNLVRQEVGAVQSPYSLVSRLFRRHPAIHFTRPYHAMVDDSVMELLQQEPHWQVVDMAEVAIQHDGYEPGTIARQNKLQKAKAAMEGFLSHHPNDSYTCSKLGALYVQMGSFNQGIDLLLQGLRSPQVDPPILYELHYHLGLAYSRVHNFPEAIRQYEAAIQQEILPRLKLGAYNNLGNLLKAQGQLAEAQAIYQKSLEIEPTFATAHYNLGMTLKAINQLPEAMTHYERAIALNPEYAEAHQNLGVVLMKLGNVPASLDAFRRAVELYDRDQSSEGDRLRQGLLEMGFKL